MNADQARDLFSAAYDRMLDDDAVRAFEDALARDADLASEYRAFCELLASANAQSVQAPDLLPAVQRKLRVRSRGKFYRDAFSENAGIASQRWILVVVAMLVCAAVCAYFALSATVLP